MSADIPEPGATCGTLHCVDIFAQSLRFRAGGGRSPIESGAQPGRSDGAVRFTSFGVGLRGDGEAGFGVEPDASHAADMAVDFWIQPEISEFGRSSEGGEPSAAA